MRYYMNITAHIHESELLGDYKDREFENILKSIKEYYHFDFLSYEAGVESWAILSNKNGKLCMIHDKLKLIFSNVRDFSFLSVKLIVLYFENYSDKVWSIDLTYLENNNNKLCWYTKEIDNTCFSTQELYYATI